jgi:hypothetical protein
MPHTRPNNATQIKKRLAKLYKFIPHTTPVEDTTGAAIVAGASSITFTTFASWATGDWVCIVGSGGYDFVQLGTKPGSSGPIPISGRPPKFAQDAGARVYKLLRVDLGWIEQGGTNLGASASKVGIPAANAGGPVAYTDGDTGDITFTWTNLESNLRAIADAFGVDENTISGAGTTDDPYCLTITADAIGSMTVLQLRQELTLINGKKQYTDILDGFPEVNVAANTSKGDTSGWPCGVKCTRLVVWDQP